MASRVRHTSSSNIAQEDTTWELVSPVSRRGGREQAASSADGKAVKLECAFVRVSLCGELRGSLNEGLGRRAASLFLNFTSSDYKRDQSLRLVVALGDAVTFLFLSFLFAV